ncbi:phosphoribosylamine--glycine ligase [Granulibacter bethesdensis]|uniref:phosphoribosylamine--glycine ligase n=1 Tax=Granulibacter bethesdensis TaxID=364410 RepID=UPI00090B715F|nr:phosphoribosylamine--glycine ligase [Granulibacter bethesdensis]APH60645.1 Phosphoribosylamine--glycine ligase [Granulibacter bethesdensis]
MRVLVIGSGGREHALCWALAASPMLEKLWCAPGNPGIAAHAELVPVPVTDIAALVAFARDHAVDLVVPGPEAPLVAGLADALKDAGIRCFGPSAAAAQLEGSKTFTKEVADAAGIPTARWERFEEAEEARAFVRRRGAPIVVKADGLAAGKGVVVAATVEEAEAAITAMLEDGSLGAAGASVVIEECLIGEEASLFALCDGEHALLLGGAQDHKRVGEGDTGPNTGGMGAYTPTPFLTPEAADAAMKRIVMPALAEMVRRGTPFRGVLFAGLMLTVDGPQLIEFNVRFGDPECQALLPRLKSDLLAALLAACDGELGAFDLRWSEDATVAVVVAAKGYPGTPEPSGPIGGLDEAAAVPGALVFHAGTTRRGDEIHPAGGRVLTVVGRGPDIQTARDVAYRAVAALRWPEGFFRRDIGWRALRSA